MFAGARPLFLFVAFALAAVLAGCSKGNPVSEPSKTPDPPKPPPVRTLDPTPPKPKTDPVPENQPTQQFTTSQGQSVQLPLNHDPWTDAVVSFTDGMPTATSATNPWGVVGKPDYRGKDDAEDEEAYRALGHGGTLVLEFIDNVLVDGPGPDLVIFEIGPAVEPTDVEISEDGQTWVKVGQAGGSKSTLDISQFVKPVQRFRFVKLTDAKAGLSSGTQWPGADIDAVGALNSRPVDGAPTRAEIETKWKR